MRSLAIALFFGALASSEASAEEAETDVAVSAAMQCTPFSWAEVGGQEKAAILVPIMLEGRTYEFQLDTGADASFIPEDIAVEAGLMRPGAGGARVQDVRLGGASLGPRWLLTRGSTGTVGLDMLVGFATVIDYPAQRLCLTPTADLPYEIYRKTSWTDAVLRDGKLFVPIEAGGESRSDFFFDTGASLFPLSVDLAEWKALTGRDAPAPEDRRIAGPAWGANVELIGAPSREPVSVASLPPRIAEVFYSTARAERFANYPFQAGGLIGNAEVWDRAIVLWLGARPQFGIVERPAER